MATGEVEVTFRYSCTTFPPLLGGFEVNFGGVAVGRRRKFLFSFTEVMIADPGNYQIELRDWRGMFRRKASTKFEVHLPKVASCEIALTLEGNHLGYFFWLIPELRITG